VVLSYEIGAKPSGFSRITGNVIGPLFILRSAQRIFIGGADDRM
jgi:hypothetical protein